jgi:hypothetical protein
MPPAFSVRLRRAGPDRFIAGAARVHRFTFHQGFATQAAYGFTGTCGSAASFAESPFSGASPRIQGERTMASTAVSSHLNALQSKHAGIEARLRDEMARPVPDTAMVQSLKKQKLRLKEEIATH